MSTGLPVSRLIRTTVNLAPLGAQYANINSALFLGDSAVIDTDTRIASYADIDEVAADFGTTAPEFLAAELFFSQVPQPTQLYIGAWARTATHGANYGGFLSAGQQSLSNFTSITTGAFKIQIDGASAVAVSSLNFSAVTNMNAVASIINAALTGATCVWNGNQFVIASATTGASSAISFATAPASGTDIKALINLTAAIGARLVVGIAAESALAAVQACAAKPTYWYALMLATASPVADNVNQGIAAYIEAAAPPRIFGVNTAEAAVLDSASSSDIASLLNASGYKRSFVQYSANPFAAASFLGRALTVNFGANNSTITLMYKTEPGVVPETITSGQADALDAKHCNVFVSYDNNTAIIEDGTMSGDAFFDEIMGTDWLANKIQTDVYNLLYLSPTKIPQTDAGVAQITNTIAASCSAGVDNGLIAPGTWTSGGFGALATGQFLPTGFYIYAPSVASQAPADRNARKAPPIQVAVKLAGAIQTVDILINVNR